MPHKNVIILLIFLNTVVLLGQIWPQGAPPFAAIVNVVTLVLNLVFLFSFLRKKQV